MRVQRNLGDGWRASPGHRKAAEEEGLMGGCGDPGGAEVKVVGEGEGRVFRAQEGGLLVRRGRRTREGFRFR